MNLIIAVLLSIAFNLNATPKQAPPVNNLETKAAHTTKAEKLTSEVKEADVPVVTVETPPAQPPESQPETEPVAIPEPPTPIYPTSHEDLMTQAGIDQNDWAAVDYIISHESGWNPNATEPTSGAHGLPQALPYSKTGCGWTDALCQLEWASQYANATYGGWQGAYAQWLAFQWW